MRPGIAYLDNGTIGQKPNLLLTLGVEMVRSLKPAHETRNYDVAMWLQ